MYNRAKYAQYNINDTACFKVDKEFNATSNNVFSTRFPVSYYANDDCTYLVGMSYIGNEKWQHITRPILSISVLKSW
ncbi:hypothetical protein GGF42_001538 [Coemansia sp. RSA 2424]|nr:hypothetical protein GGF42_001538 [Coemansia sp. RSA 2424]